MNLSQGTVDTMIIPLVADMHEVKILHLNRLVLSAFAFSLPDTSTADYHKMNIFVRG